MHGTRQVTHHHSERYYHYPYHLLRITIPHDIYLWLFVESLPRAERKEA